MLCAVCGWDEATERGRQVRLVLCRLPAAHGPDPLLEATSAIPYPAFLVLLLVYTHTP